MSAREAIKAAVAHVFAEECLDASSTGARRIASRAIRDVCAVWCAERGLPKPNAAQLAKAIRAVGGVAGKSNGQRVWRGLRWRDPDDMDFNTIANRDEINRLANIEPAIPLDAFCEIADVAMSTLYDRRARGTAPPFIKHGKRCFVRASDALAWFRRTGRHAAIIRLADWLEAQVERPSTRVAKAIRCGAVHGARGDKSAKTRNVAGSGGMADAPSLAA